MKLSTNESIFCARPTRVENTASSTSWAGRPLTEVLMTARSRSSPVQMWLQKRTWERGICSRTYQNVFSMLAHRTPFPQNPMDSQGTRWSASCSGQAGSLQRFGLGVRNQQYININIMQYASFINSLWFYHIDN